MPLVHRPTGSLPPFWNRSGVFVANVLGLFFGNTEQTREMRRQIGAIGSYGGRLVPLMGLLFRGQAPNLVVLERAPDADLARYFRDELGLRVPDVEVLSHALYERLAEQNGMASPELEAFVERVRAHPARWLDGFVTDAALEELARRVGRRTLSSSAASRAGNHKVRLHEFLTERGLPVFDTHTADSVSAVAGCAALLRGQGYRHAVVKAPIGASGIGIFRFDTSEGGRDVPPFLFHEGPCLVQGWLDATCAGVTAVHSPSVQLFLDDGSLHLFDLTEQILDAGAVHEGNVAPPPWLGESPPTRAELLRQAEIAGGWLHDQGYRGTASVDFHVAIRGGAPEVRVCEINARVTGATYPAVLAGHFRPGGAWLMRNLRFAAPIAGGDVLRALERGGRLFRPGGRGAILPINFHSDAEGRLSKGQFLCLAGTTEEARRLFDEACAILPAKGENDRD